MNLDILSKYKLFLGKRYSSIYQSFKLLSDIDANVIVELGTTHSFVRKGVEGCMNPDIKFWSEQDYANWDWGAGCFTRVCAEFIQYDDFEFHTVDPSEDAIKISKIVTENLKHKVKHHQTYSTDFLRKFDKKIDFLYMDHHETCEAGALLHFQDAKILVEEDKLAKKCIILIDDVLDDRKLPIFVRLENLWRHRNTEYLGKGTYSIPYFLENGFKIELKDYQYLLTRGL